MELGTQQLHVTSARSTPKALSATSVLATMPATQWTALPPPLRDNATFESCVIWVQSSALLSFPMSHFLLNNLTHASSCQPVVRGAALRTVEHQTTNEM